MPRKTVRIEQPPVVLGFAAKLRGRRLALGLTQAALGERAELSTNHVNSLEAGRAAPGLDVMERLATALSVPLADLLPAGATPDEHGALKKEVQRIIKAILDTADMETLRALVPLLARFSGDPVGRG